MSKKFPESIRIYHVTSLKNIESIQSGSLRANSYWASNIDISDYYKETIEDEEEVPVFISVKLDDLVGYTLSQGKEIEPDFPGLEEPITTVLGMSELDINKAWKNSDKTWQDCLELIGSIRCPVNSPKIQVTSASMEGRPACCLECSLT